MKRTVIITAQNFQDEEFVYPYYRLLEEGYEVEVATPDIFRRMMMEIKTRFSDIIKDYSTLHIYQVHKYNFCPSIQSSIQAQIIYKNKK